MNKFEEDVELRAMKKLAGLKFTDCNRFLGIIPKTLVEKVAMIKLAVMFDDIIPVQYRSDNAMGKFTAKQQQNLVAQGKMPSKRIIMDHMRRSGYHHMDNIGAITLDFNDMTGNLGAISKARHKLIPHLSVGNVADKDFLANIIIEYLNRETNNGITRSLGEVAANALNHYKNMNNNIAFNQVDIENAEKLCKILGIQEESDLIPNIFKDRNKASNTPIAIIPKDNAQNYSRLLGTRTSKSNGKIVGIGRDANKKNLRTLLHEIDEATLYSNSHDVGRDIKRTLNDTHFGTEVMADELMNNNILFGNDYNSTMYDPVRKGRAQQYNGTIIDPKDPQKARKIYPPQTHSEIGNLLGVEKNENKRLYGLRREGLKPTKWATEAYDMVLPNISQKEFIARAKQIDSDLRAKIRNNQKVNSFSSRSSQAAENLLPNSSIKNVSNWVNNNRKLLATGGGLAALGGFIYLINRYRGNNENNG